MVEKVNDYEWEKVASQKFSFKKIHNNDTAKQQNRPPPNMSLQHKDYFELQANEKQIPPPIGLKSGHKFAKVSPLSLSLEGQKLNHQTQF